MVSSLNSVAFKQVEFVCVCVCVGGYVINWGLHKNYWTNFYSIYRGGGGHDLKKNLLNFGAHLNKWADPGFFFSRSWGSDWFKSWKQCGLLLNTLTPVLTMSHVYPLSFQPYKGWIKKAKVQGASGEFERYSLVSTHISQIKIKHTTQFMGILYYTFSSNVYLFTCIY